MLLVDTGPLIALCDPQDTLNKTALKDLTTLQKSQFLVCEPVIVEACFHLPVDAQRQRLQQTLERLRIEPVPVGNISSLWRDVFAWLHKYGDHAPDWADAYLAVLCSRDRKLKLWTYDLEFRTIWRRLDGSRIPLAISPRLSDDKVIRSG
jgi:predicted nucleic acid-binding protein